MLIYLGDIAEGLALLDEAMVAIEAGEVSPLATGDAYCSVIDACSELSDLGRCRAWTESFVRWCDTQQELVLYRGHCFLHRAEVLELLGAWPAGAGRGTTRLQSTCRTRPPRRPRRCPCHRGRHPPPGRRLRRRRHRVPARQRVRPRPPTRLGAAATRPGTARDCRRDDPQGPRRSPGPDLAGTSTRPLRRDRSRLGRHHAST